MSTLSTFFDPITDGRITAVYVGLVVILMIMLGGTLPSVPYVFSRNALWIIWGLFLLFIIILGIQLQLHRLVLPAMPLMAWLAVYICWGILAAPYPILGSGSRLGYRFLCIIASMAIVTSHPRRLALFANATQWTLLVNLLVTAWLITHPEYQEHPFFLRLNETFSSDRFAGMWGNANEAGLAALFILVLSHWAKRWIAWIGRISGLMIIYLTESRTAFWIAMTLAMLYLLFAFGKRSRYRVVMIAMVLILLGVGYLGSSKNGDFSFIKGNPSLARVFDLSESKTRQRGDASRMDLANQWLPIATKGPWFGYGLFSSEGDESQETKVKRHFPAQGTHNLYLALYIDAGWVGLLLFLFVITRQLFKIRGIPLDPAEHRMMFALCFVMLVFSLANHTMVTDFTGWIGFSLIFLLPMSPALRDSQAA